MMMVVTENSMMKKNLPEEELGVSGWKEGLIAAAKSAKLDGNPLAT
jgi:hypothetical protein